MTALTSANSDDGDADCPDTKRVGAAIRAIRKRLGFTQVAFSKTLSIQQNTLSQFETGHTKPTTERLIHLLRMACTDGERAPIVAALEHRGILASDLAISGTPIPAHRASLGDQQGACNV